MWRKSSAHTIYPFKQKQRERDFLYILYSETGLILSMKCNFLWLFSENMIHLYFPTNRLYADMLFEQFSRASKMNCYKPWTIQILFLRHHICNILWMIWELLQLYLLRKHMNEATSVVFICIAILYHHFGQHLFYILAQE